MLIMPELKKFTYLKRNCFCKRNTKYN